MKNLILNKIKCNSCNDEVISYYRHDFKFCKCGKIANDGGLDYQHIIGEKNSYTNMAIYSDAPFEIIRENFYRGGRGKDGKQSLTWVAMNEMSNNWLEACIQYNNERGYEMSLANTLYQRELDYRKENNIFIED